jgi:polyhydroxybutyrate depolymerase
MNAAAAHMAVQDAWPEAVVVYLQGLPSPGVKSKRGEAPGWQFEAGQANDRDLKFVDAVLATMKQNYAIDANRVYASGFSQGAYFTLLLWSKRAQDFAAFAACGVALIPPLQLTQPRAYLQISGEDDQVIPITAQKSAIAAAKQVNGATGIGQPCGMGCTRYESSGGTPVVTLIHLGGHIYPSGLSARVVEFFKQQQRH